MQVQPKPQAANEKEAEKPCPAPEMIAFANGQQLLTDRTPGAETVRLLDRRGRVQITIALTETGSEISLAGDIVRIDAKEKLEINSPVIDLKADRNLHLQSGGDFQLTTVGDSRQTARVHHIVADLGNVNIKANDDVKLDGERVKLNCTD